MHTLRLTIFFVVLCGGLFFLPGATVAENPSVNVTTSIDDDTDEVLVFFESTADTNSLSASELQSHAADSQSEFLQRAAETDGLEVKTEFWITSAVLVEINTSAVPIETIAAETGAVAIHENVEVESHSVSAKTGETATAIDADPLSASVNASATYDSSVQSSATTYGLETIDAPRVWSTYDAQGAGISVAVLDTGVEPDHPDIELYTTDSTDPTYPGGWAEFNGDGHQVPSQPYDSGTHGTHVSGTVAGGNHSGTHVGVAPDVELMHGKVLDGGIGSGAGLLAGMQWAVDNDADIIALSLGSEELAPELIDPIEDITQTGTVVISSSGNNGDGMTSTPGNLYSVVGTGAVDSSNNVAPFSGGAVIETDETWGSAAPSSWPDTYVVPTITAPGVSVNSTVPGGEYNRFSGTSMAAPHVAGTVALVQSAAPDDTDVSPTTTRSILTETATEQPPGPDTRYGSGIVNAFNAAMKVNDDGIVHGTITATDGEPITDATVEVGGTETTTDGAGTYEIHTDAGDTELTVSASGYKSQTLSVDIVAGQSATQDVQLAANGHPSGVSQELFDAVDRDGTETLSRADVRNMINEYAQSGTVDGVEITRSDVRSLINWYAQQ